MKFSICNEIFQGWKLEDVFRSAKSIGYDAVEIAPFTLAEYDEQISAEERTRIRESAKNAGIGISGIHWVLVKPDGLSINGPDAAVRERTAGYFKELVDFCADIGGREKPSSRDAACGQFPTAATAHDTMIAADRIALLIIMPVLFHDIAGGGRWRSRPRPRDRTTKAMRVPWSTRMRP